MISSSVDYTIVPTDYVIIVEGTDNITLTLPNPSDNNGREIVFKHNASASHTTTIDADGFTIDGISKFLMDTVYSNMELFSNGSEWLIMNN